MNNKMIYMAVVIMVVGFSPAYAITANSTNVKAGITPDQGILWSLDMVVEKVQLVLTFNPVAKIKKRMQFADERLAEAQVMVNENKTKYALVALKADSNELSNAQQEITQIHSHSGIETAMKAIQSHQQMMKVQKQAILNKLPHNSPARQDMMQAFAEINNHTSTTMQKLESIKAKQNEKIQDALASMHMATGINANEGYQSLMNNGEVSSEVINQALTYANSQIVAKSMNLSKEQGNVAHIIMKKSNKITQNIYLNVQNNKLVEVSPTPNITYTIKMNVENIPAMIENAQAGNTRYLMVQLGRDCGMSCIGLVRDVLSSPHIITPMGNTKAAMAGEQRIEFHTSQSDSHSNGIMNRLRNIV